VSRLLAILAISMTGTFALAVAPHSAAANVEPCLNAGRCPRPVVDVQTGYRYSYDNGNIVAMPAISHSSSGGPAMEYRVLPACFNNRPPSGDGSDPGRDDHCLGALTSPRCAVGEILVWTYSRRAGSSQAWVQTGQRCIGVRRVVPVAAVRDAVREELAKRVADPRFEVRPGEATLVNLPVIAYVTDSGRKEQQRDCAHPEGVCFSVTQPVPGRLEARPVYVWDFGQGPEAEGRGRPYDGTSPREVPDYYVSHTYMQRGPQRVRLTVGWRATFTVAGLPPIELADLPRSAEASFPVLEAWSELVSQ